MRKEFKQFIFVLAFGAALSACKNSEEKMQPGNSALEIDTLSPAIAYPGTKVVIYGKNFPLKDIKVFFGDVEADSIVKIYEGSVEVIVPKLKEKEYQVKVTTNDQKLYSNTYTFNLQDVPQKISSLYFSTNSIWKAEINSDTGIVVKELFEDDHPRGLIVDKGSNTAYWANYHGYVQKANLDSMKREVLLFVGEVITDFEMDPDKKFVYIGKEDRIIRKSLEDTTQTTVLFKDRQQPFNFEIDHKRGKLYWMEWDPLHIFEANLDGTGEPVVVMGPDQGLVGPRAMDLDAEGGKMYVADVPDFLRSKVLEYDLKTKEVRTLITTETGVGEYVTDVKLDKENGYLYIMNSKGRNFNHFDDGEIIRIPLNDPLKKEVVVQPINHGYQIAL